MRFCQLKISFHKEPEKILSCTEYPTSIIELKLSDFRIFASGISYGFILLKLLKLLDVADMDLSPCIGLKLKLANNNLRNGRIDMIINRDCDIATIVRLTDALRTLCGEARLSPFTLSLLPKHDLEYITFTQKYLLQSNYDGLLVTNEIKEIDTIISMPLY